MESVGRDAALRGPVTEALGGPRAGPGAGARRARQLGRPRRPPRAPTPSTGGPSPRPEPRSPSASGSSRLVEGGDARRGRCRPRDVLRTAYREQLLGIAALDLTSPDPLEPPARDGAARSPTSRRPRWRRPWPSPARRSGRMPTARASRSSAWARPAAASSTTSPTSTSSSSPSRPTGSTRTSLDGGRDRPRDPADADLLGVDGRPAAVAGRPRAAPRGQERPAGAHRREPPRLLRALGQDLGVPGAAQGAPGRGRRRGGAGLLRRGAADGVAGRRAARTSSTTCRRCAAGSSSTSPPAEADRQLKLGAGGLRDVEFSVQLLQLVHGRADESLRTATTLDGAGRAVRRRLRGARGRRDARHGYRLLRTLEHRIQLFRLRRTHLMPTAESDLRRLGRALGHRSSPAEAVVAQWRAAAARGAPPARADLLPTRCCRRWPGCPTPRCA